MDIYGIDFTSRPKRRKPITCLSCKFDDSNLIAGDLERLYDFPAFETVLARPGPWIAGIDFPFGQSRKFVETIGWPEDWEGYVRYAASLGRTGFRNDLDKYREHRPKGDKEHRRETDKCAGSISPQKLYGVPVGLMFFEGARRLIDANVTIPHMREGDPDRIAFEAYPGVLARAIIGRQSYKNDTPAAQTPEQAKARKEIFNALTSSTGARKLKLEFRIKAPETLAEDPSGDELDALLCAVQAAWAFTQRNRAYGANLPVDQLEGWIADPTICVRPAPD